MPAAEPTPRRLDGVVVFAPEGFLDSRSAPPLRRAVLESIDAGDTVVLLDCSSLLLIDAKAVRSLKSLDKRLRSLEGKLALCSLTDSLQTAFRETGLDSAFQVFPHREEALRSLRVDREFEQPPRGAEPSAYQHLRLG